MHVWPRTTRHEGRWLAYLHSPTQPAACSTTRDLRIDLPKAADSRRALRVGILTDLASVEWLGFRTNSIMMVGVTLARSSGWSPGPQPLAASACLRAEVDVLTCLAAVAMGLREQA